LAINDKDCGIKSGGWYIGMKNFGKPKKPEKTEDEKTGEANKDMDIKTESDSKEEVDSKKAD
jgi:hypothetical protein